MNHPKVTVIIPVYKVEKYLRGSIQSVLDQTYDNVDIILVDDGSPDNCPQICDEYAKKFPNIHVIHKTNGGLSSARNAGLDSIYETEYVLFLDSDDQLERNAIEGLVKSACETLADMVIPDRYTKVDESTGYATTALLFPESMYNTDPVAFAIEVLIGQARGSRSTALLYRYRPIMEHKIRFPVGKIAEDISFNLDVLSCVERIAFYPFSTLKCLKRDGSISSTYQKNFEESIWYIDEMANKFLNRTNSETIDNKRAVDGLLARNIVTYLFSIMSSKNAMNQSEKIAKADALLRAPEARDVVRKKQNAPWFEKMKVREAYKLVYLLLRMRMDRVVYWLLAFA